ncbi:hypothetical protein BM536_031995 [Streptomyces phaeoluteigriseus]|uniref:Uncharacterized protein n=1 Tax=Streptomyces phaeoluteigriseus TaxID=114686 RepID=A0A1V6MJW1_9ACTN|nr:hypothetical protein [Streptomyces phaeoluteigriseus]OQD52734.1 hypothetical protein BM536_031995 [Streptomyces phaeoluteigriseus]
MPRDLATAQAELDTARATLATLQEQVRDGSPDVTPQQLADQRELIAFAELRVEAAQRTETRIRDEERAALGAAAKRAAVQLIEGDGMDAVAAAERAAVDALAHLASVAYARNARIAEVGTMVVRLDGDLEVAGAGKAPGNTRRYGIWGDRGHVVVQGVGSVSLLDVGALTTTAVVAGLGVDPVGRDAQTRHMTTFHGLRDQVVHGLLEAYPQLAEVLHVTPEEFAAADERGRYLLTLQGRRPVAQEVPA